MSEYEDLIGDVAKIPDWHDMDYGQFRAHWFKRHSYMGYFAGERMAKYEDDDAPIWWAIKGHHDRIHAGTMEIPKPDGGVWPPPSDHIHLPPVDPEIQRLLEELI